MNTAYKWYRYNSNIIQFYSDNTFSKNRTPNSASCGETSAVQDYNLAATSSNYEADISIN